MKALKRFILGIAVLGLGLVGAAGLYSSPVSAANFTPGDECTAGFLGFPAWYEGLPKGPDCSIGQPAGEAEGGGLSPFIFRIVLNVIEIALRIVGYASVGYIMYGGFKYLTSSGSADKTAAARKTILNAVIGLIISFLSVVIVTIIASRITA